MALTPSTHGLDGYHNSSHQALVTEAQQPFRNDISDHCLVLDEEEIPADDDGRLNSPIALDDIDPAAFQAFQIYPDIQKPCYGYDMQGDMFYRHDKEGLWIPAYRHVDIRQWLLEDADHIGVYDTPAEQGSDVLDRTSFLLAHKTWGSDRPHRPEILFTHNPTADRSIDQYEVQTMQRYGKIVIGSDDLPVKDYRNIPDTISTAIEGFRLEAIERQDIRIKHQDFRSRMLPHSISKFGGVAEPPSENTLSARMRRFRTLACLYCWGVDRDGSVLDKDFVEKKLPRMCKLANSTQGFRDLYKHELVERELLTYGKCLSRAGARGIPEATRIKRREDLQSKYRRLLEKHEETHSQLLDGDADVQTYGEQRGLDSHELDLPL